MVQDTSKKLSFSLPSRIGLIMEDISDSTFAQDLTITLRKKVILIEIIPITSLY